MDTCVSSPTAERTLPARRVQQLQQELAISIRVWLCLDLPLTFVRQQRCNHILSSLWG